MIYTTKSGRRVRVEALPKRGIYTIADAATGAHLGSARNFPLALDKAERITAAR